MDDIDAMEFLLDKAHAGKAPPALSPPRRLAPTRLRPLLERENISLEPSPPGCRATPGTGCLLMMGDGWFSTKFRRAKRPCTNGFRWFVRQFDEGGNYSRS